MTWGGNGHGAKGVIQRLEGGGPWEGASALKLCLAHQYMAMVCSVKYYFSKIMRFIACIFTFNANGVILGVFSVQNNACLSIRYIGASALGGERTRDRAVRR